MATQVEIQRKEWQDWVDRLVNNPDCVATQLEEAAKLLKDNISLQNESKWGVKMGLRRLPRGIASIFSRKWQPSRVWRKMLVNSLAS